MYKKKVIVLALSSLMMLSLPVVAQEFSSRVEVAEPEAPTDSVSTTESEAPTDLGTTAESSPSTGTDSYTAMQERWRERDARYEELKKRAEEVGVMLPDEPPWKSAGKGAMPRGAYRLRHQEMMSMTPEERMAAREAYYQEMQARASERGAEKPEPVPWAARRSAMQQEWAKQQAVIDGMTEEERAACHAMHRRHWGMMRQEMLRRTPMQGPDMMGPGATEPGWWPGVWGHGYDYGYAPNPYGAPNFWDPNY
jgi:hypothetical protein